MKYFKIAYAPINVKHGLLTYCYVRSLFRACLLYDMLLLLHPSFNFFIIMPDE